MLKRIFPSLYLLILAVAMLGWIWLLAEVAAWVLA
jgi:hypothetical protein